MNPVDHPMGGGEGRSSGGRHPCSPWGVPTKGYKTRKNKSSDRLIVKKRTRNNNVNNQYLDGSIYATIVKKRSIY